LPIWVAPESLNANGLGARLLDAARRVAGDMEGGTAELSEITDPAYLEQLIQLGYIEGSAH
ncbi:MAG: hypothetical protein VYC95_00015, partial [Verrucomicrobiota bacterium]|nr:hypothetical protein [Verrucomicrobiota bacterium]